jgi:hypothetical protein
MRTIVLLTTFAVLGTTTATVWAGPNVEARRERAIEKAQQNVERWQQFQRDANETLDRLREQLVQSTNDHGTPPPEPSYDDSDDLD